MNARVRLLDADDAPGLDFRVSVVEPTVTADHPATLEITVVNTGAERRHLQAADGERRVFTQRTSEQSDPGLVLLTDADISADVRDESGCWKLTRVPSVMTMVAYHVAPEPGESASERFQLRQHPENACEGFPTGEFRFEDEFEARPTGTLDDRTRFRWGFTIAVERE